MLFSVHYIVLAHKVSKVLAWSRVQQSVFSFIVNYLQQFHVVSVGIFVKSCDCKIIL